MFKNRFLHDGLLGGGLMFALLFIFVADRLLSPAPPQDDGKQQVVRKAGTLLGDNLIVVQMQALGSEEQLAKLKVVRLKAKAAFAKTNNVNDIALTWCWDPETTIRFDEYKKRSEADTFAKALGKLDRASKLRLLESLKQAFELTPALSLKFDQECERLFAAKDLKPFDHTAIVLDDRGTFRIFNGRLSLPLKPAQTIQVKNLLFALSVSNLIPIRRHNFEILAGTEQTVRDRPCDQFTIQGSAGLKLQFYFDKETHLLSKISHLGHDPLGQPGDDRQVLWEHYFSDYRETNGIKQWRKSEVDNDGRRFATLTVTDVEFFDELQPELRLP